jgi:hypothetical protein
VYDEGLEVTQTLAGSELKLVPTMIIAMPTIRMSTLNIARFINLLLNLKQNIVLSELAWLRPYNGVN